MTTPSHACPSRIPRKVDTLKPRNPKSRNAGECSGGPRTQKPILLRFDDWSEAVRFCLLFVPLCAVLLVSACFVLWVERLTRQPRLEIDDRRCHRNPRTGLS
ncbi:hypothetical protein CRG98_007321 [Punica granatum]|uniref:Uncharacterized protein n=1 Tax=Punica granatum TaxID=22663 RepID=A0A2I0KUU9_PUNGR|nr:hypothetical protein CRG98_007321 [Punica granatum]